MALSPRKTEPLQQGDVLVVVHDFDARSPDELTLRKSERVELVELDDGFGDGWYLGRHLSRETTGLFPGVYCAKLPSHLAILPPSNTPKHFSHLNKSLPEPPLDLSTSAISSQNRPQSTPKFAPYQHRSEPVGANVPENSYIYGQVTSQASQRNTMPTTQGTPGANQRSIGGALGGLRPGQDSPVMNETLNVIDEHITDLSNPRQNLSPNLIIADDSGSDYSNSHIGAGSYVAGPETDDEENEGLTRAEVSKWNYKQTAAHLRAIGVDARHCDIFEEQEITGEVLLEMDQSFIYMKEYDFGVMGRRLKTWHKIRDFQNRLQGPKPSRHGSIVPSTSTEDVSRQQSRVLSGGTILPRIPSLMEEPGLAIRQSQQNQSPVNGASKPPPLQSLPSGNSVGASNSISAWRSSMGPESPNRPSAAAIRELGKSRRHSSIDYDQRQTRSPVSNSFKKGTTLHKKQNSLDRDWSMSTATRSSTLATIPSTHAHTVEKKKSLDMLKESPIATESPLELERGYFSGNEVDNRKNRNLLRKKEGIAKPTHSRQSSLQPEPTKPIATSKRHSRINSVDSSRDQVNPLVSPASKAYHGKSIKTGRFRSASTRDASPSVMAGGGSPTVTNLEKNAILRVPSLPSPVVGGPYTNAMATAQEKARKILGMRATSDAVTNSEKENLTSPPLVAGSIEESPEQSPDSSHTPSARSPSLDLDNTDASSKNTDQPSSALSNKGSTKVRQKTKQQTSAYTRGLLKISPAEARKQCDYSGWMKKKSSSLMTTWKPRLFILRGKRLSYYYSETDTEERGIIDISAHKVLVATSDPITMFHAQITGATTAASPNPSTTSVNTSTTSKSQSNTASTPFYFKLVPPKAGLSRAVQFTKPTVHYFQCDSAIDGRKWMGEIMKATIEHDLSSFESTNKQKTISLAKARARKERPPALQETHSESAVAQAEARRLPDFGLNIQGLGLEEKEGTRTPDTAEVPSGYVSAVERVDAAT